MSRKWLYVLFMAIFLSGVLISCNDKEDEEITVDSSKDMGAEITFNILAETGALSRTVVVDPGSDGSLAKHHVTRIELFVYDSDGNYIGHDPVDWPYRMDSVGQSTQYCKHQLSNGILEEIRKNPTNRYTLLAVGLDDVWMNDKYMDKYSAEAYNLPESIEDKPLNKAIASLASRKSRNNIAESELFSGYEEVTGSQLLDGKSESRESASSVTINLYRRVAGIKLYVKKIPKVINDKDVKYLVLRLCGRQNTQVNLIRQLPDGYDKDASDLDIPDSKYVDFIESRLKTNDGDIVLKVDLVPGNTRGAGGGGNSGNVGHGEGNCDPVDPDTPVGEDENFLDPCFVGVYMLPAKFEDDAYTSSSGEKSTLMLQLLDAKGGVLASRRIRLETSVSGREDTRSGTGIIETPSENTYRYPIRANNFYRIGTKENPVEIDGSSSDILIQIDDVWDEYYGGAMDGSGTSGMGIDNSWGEHEGGNLVTE